MMKTKIIFFLFIILILMEGCINKKRENIKSLEIAIWGSFKELKIIEESIKLFNKKYPDIKVILSHSPQGQGYIDKILTRAAGGNLPDILFCEVNFIDKFIQKNLLLDLTPFIEKEKSLSINDYFPQIIQRFMVNGRIYALPRDVAPFACIYYNKNLFDEAGIDYPDDTWDMNKFLSIAKKLTKKDKSGRIVQYGFYGWCWQNFVNVFGGRLVDDIKNPTKCLLNQNPAVEGMKFYSDLIYKYKVMPPPGSIEMGLNEMFMSGRIAMYNSGIWETPIFRDIKDFEWDIVMFPKGPTGKRGFATGGSGYAISATTKDKRMAWELLKIIAGEYGQIQLAQAGLAQPALKKLAYSKYWAFDKINPPANKGMLNEAVKYIIFNPFITEWGEYEQKFINPVVDLIIRNRKGVKQGLNEITEKINKALMKRFNAQI